MGVYHVNNGPAVRYNIWAKQNANFYPRAIMGTFTKTGASYRGTNGRGRVAGGAVFEENYREGGKPLTVTNAINSATAAGTLLKNGRVYVVTEEDVSITGAPGQSALVVEEYATVVLYIPEGKSLTVTGGSGEGTRVRACAGIRLPSSSTLVICGEGRLSATGGAGIGHAAPAGIGCGGQWNPIRPEHSSSASGIGGDGESLTASLSKSSMGRLYVLGSLTLTATPGAAGTAEAGGDPGLFCTSEAIKPTLNVVGREPDGHADTHWSIHYDVTLVDTDGSVLGAGKATLAMPYDKVVQPTRDDMVFLCYTNNFGRPVIGPFGGATGLPCTTIGAHAVSAVWVYGVNITDDPVPYSFDDDKVSLREVIDRIGQALEGRPIDRPFPVPISPLLTNGTEELVLNIRPDQTICSPLSARTPIVINGRAAGRRPLVLDGGGTRTAPMLSVTNGMGLVLQNVTLRNATHVAGSVSMGLAVYSQDYSSLVVSNVLFTAFAANEADTVVTALGDTRILRTTWLDCGGIPAILWASSATGSRQVLAESTVVPNGSTEKIIVFGKSAAVLACTVPNGVDCAGGTVRGCITDETDPSQYAATPTPTNVCKVTQYFYEVPRTSDLAKDGKGCTVWHDADWRNVATSERTSGKNKTAVFGEPTLARQSFAYDVRGSYIDFLWNTCGSYAISWMVPPLVVSTTEDQGVGTMNLMDEKVSLREAMRVVEEVPGVRNPDGTPHKITFSDKIFKNGEAVFYLDAGTLTNGATDHVTADAPLWIAGPTDGREVILSGSGTMRILEVNVGSFVRLSDVTLTEGCDEGFVDGAAIWSPGALELERCTLSDNTGSAVWVDEGPLVVRGCTFTGNGSSRSDVEGGAIHQWSGYQKGTGVVTVVDSVFENNSAYIGGAIAARGELHVSGSTFRENEAFADEYGGGAIYFCVDFAAPMTVDTSVFENNLAAHDGGAIRVQNWGRLSIERSTFTGNTAENRGGAITSWGPVALTGVTFANNEAFEDGGAACLGNGALSIGKCRFEGNDAQADGGAVRITGAGDSILIEETSFVGNKAVFLGGAVVCDGDASGRFLTVVNASFLDNRAGDGGGICQSGCDAALANVTFRGNTALGRGGAYSACSAGNERLSFANVIASGNTASGDSETDDFSLGSAPFVGYSSAIRSGVLQDSSRNLYAGSYASENTIYKYSAAKRTPSEFANGAKQTGERIRANSLAQRGAVVSYDGGWTNVDCVLYGGKTSLALRGSAGEGETPIATDLTARAYPDGQTPSMGSLWHAPDPPSKIVTTLRDVEDEYDGRTSLREAIGNLQTSAAWREALWNAAYSAYEVLFDPVLTGALELTGRILIPNLDGAAVFVRVPGERVLSIDGGRASRAFVIAKGGILDLANLTIANCRSRATDTAGYEGGAIVNLGTLNVSNVAFVACSTGPTNATPAAKGGALFAGAGSTTRLRNCSFTGCLAACGGAVATAPGSTFTAVNATFVDNAVCNEGYGSLARGNAVFIDGADADALFAQCTFARNSGSDHMESNGGSAVFVNNAGTEAGTVSFVNSVLLGNGTCDLATSGRVRLVGSVFGVRQALASSDDPWCAAYSKYVTEAISPADVYAHTAADGTPETREIEAGPVRHVVVPLLSGATQPSVFVRYMEGWEFAGWGAKSNTVNGTFRGPSAAVRLLPVWTQDLVSETVPATTNWLGALIAREAKTSVDPEPSGPVPGVVTEPTYKNFAETVRAAQTAVSDDVVITLAENVKNKTIFFPQNGEIILSSPATVTIRGPLTLDAQSLGRFFSVERGVTLRLVDITLQNGDVRETRFPYGGAVVLDNVTGTRLAALEAYNCTFSNCWAEAGGAIYANGLGCSETFDGCVFADNGADAEMGAAIYHDDMNLTLTDTTVDLDDIWPRPEVALELGRGAFALFADPGGDTDEAALLAAADEAEAMAAAMGVRANVRCLTFAAAKAVGGEAALKAMTPVAEEIDLSAVSGEGDEKVVTLTPKNVVPYLWYALEHAETPVGPYTVESGGWVQANPDGTLPKALTAPAEGASGFYRIVVRE